MVLLRGGYRGIIKPRFVLGDFFQNQDGFQLMHKMQEQPGTSVALATNVAVALGRNVATLTYAAYTPGANWANSSAQIARHTAGAVATIQQDGIIAAGKTWEYPVVISNRTAGSVSLTGGDVSASANGTTVVTITATGTDVIITPTSDFDGDIDLAQGTVKQTNIAASTAFPGAELLVDGDMEAATAAAYSAGNSATLSKQTTTPHGGTRVLRVARNGVNNPQALQGVLTIGKRYLATAWVRSDGNSTPNMFVGSSLTVSGTTSTSWQLLEAEFVSDGTNFGLRVITSTGTEYAEFDDVSVTEANPLNGDYAGGVTLGVAGNSQIPYMPEFDGATGYCDIYSAELNSMFNPDAGTLIAFARSNTWAAGIDLIVRLGVDANNEVFLSRSGSDLILSYDAGGTAESVTIASGSPTGIFMVALSWDTTGGGAVKAYYNGAQSGSTQTIAGTFVGNLASTLTVIGANSDTPTNAWDGGISYPPLYSRVLTDSEILQIARAGGAA